jgi:type II secretory pathway pseudopilin PulG
VSKTPALEGSGPGPAKKANFSRLTITLAVVAIVAILALGLVLGLGVVVQGKAKNATETMTVGQTIYQTVQGQGQTLVYTTSLSPSTVTVTTVETTSTTSRSTVSIPVTSYVTETETTSITGPTSIVTSSSSTSVLTMLPAGSQIDFTSGERFTAVPQASLNLGFNGFFIITFQTVNSTAIHWVLEGNDINETSYSQSAGGVEFPVQSGIDYTLLVYNDQCTPFVCDNAFNVTASIFYEY